MAMKTARLLAENVLALLARHKMTQHDLAFACHHSDAWATDLLKNCKGGSWDDLGLIADLFGLEPYHLLVPGVAETSERRSGTDRRVVKDRRKTIQERHMMSVARDIERYREKGGPHDASAAEKLRRIGSIVASTRDSLNRLASVLADREAEDAQAPLPRTRRRVRNRGRADDRRNSGTPTTSD